MRNVTEIDHHDPSRGSVSEKTKKISEDADQGEGKNVMLFTDAVKCLPRPRADSVITEKGAKWRICVLSGSLVRVEYSPDGIFEDRPTQTVIRRDFGSTPKFEVRDEGDLVVVETRSFRLTYDKGPFTREGLSLLVKTVGGNFNEWHYGNSATHGNLGGTVRTLDECDGSIPLDDGLVSGDGWAVLDDSASNELVETRTVNGQSNPYGIWPQPRAHAEQDIYLFAHGHDYPGAIADLYRLTGPQPLLPRWALGNWWSRFYPYTQQGYEDLQKHFKKAGIPFSVAIIDMDWHRVDDVDPKYGSTWTGYSWNRKLFPEPTAFLAELHKLGLKTALNIHPRDGIRAFEDDYPIIARQMGVDPASGVPVSFDIASPKFDQAYFDLHHRMEKQGVDFWWVDWQQGGASRQKGLDPLWMLNHLHYLDSAVDPSTGKNDRWPLTFSRYAGIGSHRYPVGFSGDTVVSWESLRFQPYFTATASNVGYGWWSNDIGGHMLGTHDDALQARWYWLGAFSPINRLHSSASEFLDKNPTSHPEPYRSAMIRALRTRHELLPYLYTMNWRAHVDGRPLIEPMYWDNPDNPTASLVPDEYMFGSQILVSPVVDPDDAAVKAGPAKVWLPKGDWFDLFDGRRYASPGKAGRLLKVWRAFDRVPAFVKAGGIVPTQVLPEGDQVNAVGNPSLLRVLVFPGASGRFDLIEDDGVYSPDDSKIRTATTPLAFDWDAGTFTIGAVKGARDASVVPANRAWSVVFRGVANPFSDGASEGEVRVRVNGEEHQAHATYDAHALSLVVELEHVDPHQSAQVLVPGLRVADNPVEQDSFAVLSRSDMPNMTKETLMTEIRQEGSAAAISLDALESDPARDQVAPGFSMRGLLGSHVPRAVASALLEVLLR